jgi:hypothetical protein
MAKMAGAMTGANLSPNHGTAGVSLLDQVFRLERRGETRPARAAVKRVNRSEQPLARHDIHANTWLFVVPIVVIKWPFCFVTLRRLLLLGEKRRKGGATIPVGTHLDRRGAAMRSILPFPLIANAAPTLGGIKGRFNHDSYPPSYFHFNEVINGKQES